MPRSIMLVVLLGLMTGNGYSQATSDKTPPLPEGPLLKPVEDFSKWVMTLTYSDEKPNKPGDPPEPPGPPKPAYLKARARTITTIKTKNIIHEAMVAISGEPMDKWYVGDHQYTKIPTSPIWFVNMPVAASHNDSYSPLPRSGFRNLDWIAPDTYTGIENHGGKKCIVFRSTGKEAGPDGSNTLVAYIDIETRWPVETQIEGVDRVYQFVTAPTDMQSIPDDLNEQIEKANKILKQIDTRAPTAP